MRFGANRCRLIFGCALTLSVSLSAYGQRAGSASVLKLTLSNLAPIVCSDRSLLLELQMENVGREEIKIDRTDLWRSFAYGYLTNNSGRSMGRGGGMGTSCSHCRGNYLSLMPGAAHWERYEFKLNDFFQDAGNYSLHTRVAYELGEKELSSDSNEIEFEVLACSTN